ncbi:hypothetical protein C1H46_032964 [Malus baccata]|uniref:Uncharacterized protein n=1 Tax=Malus baccata TaxID=106549 RepID=A0A540L4R0_MALBA|nr:hypothetical protein C1H46_032962 [Malus baccata]TQD81471.1 hypothetical protein C1H46_032964 [Malus baccata]
MEPPPSQAIDTSTKKFQIEEDEQDKVIDDCCSCFYDCTETCFDYLFCNLC